MSRNVSRKKSAISRFLYSGSPPLASRKNTVSISIVSMAQAVSLAISGVALTTKVAYWAPSVLNVG